LVLKGKESDSGWNLRPPWINYGWIYIVVSYAVPESTPPVMNNKNLKSMGNKRNAECSMEED
jgi:hypothetical protein